MSPPSAGRALRALLPALANKIYFNYGGQGPLPEPSLLAIEHCFRAIQELGPFSEAVWPLVSRTCESLRARLGSRAWLGVGPRRLAFTENVTSGCVLPLWGLPWQAGDQLLLSDAEHPGVVAACRELAVRQGLELASFAVADLDADAATTAELLLQRLDQALTPRTRLVVLSHLLWNSGQLMPIVAVAERLATHRRQPWLLVDAAQSLGSIPVADAAAAADIYACTGHKWCGGPEGLGVVAVSERLLEQASPTLIGWRSLAEESQGSSGFHRDARRFEVATSCIPLFAGLDCSLQLLEAEGSAEQRLAVIRAASARLWHGLQVIPGLCSRLRQEPPAGLVSFRPSDPTGPDPGSLLHSLSERRFCLRVLDQPLWLRACVHITTELEEIDQLLENLAVLLEQSPC